MKILITGAAGFIGFHLSLKLLKESDSPCRASKGRKLLFEGCVALKKTVVKFED